MSESAAFADVAVINPDADRYSDAHSNADCHGNGYRYADPHADVDPDINSYCYIDPHADVDPDTNIYADPHADPHTHGTTGDRFR